MKKLTILFCFLCAVAPIRAQITVGDVNINDPANGIHYITLNLQMSRWWIDYGEDVKRKDMETREVKDANGEKPASASMLALFNWLRENGWEFVQNAPPPYMGVETWLFKRIE